MASIKIYCVDAFTGKPYTGNPAAVCLLPAKKPDEWMQSVAREMNLSETAFLVPVKEGEYNLRWFTPLTQVDLCGHATLAAAHILWQTGVFSGGRITFRTKSGPLTASRADNGVELDFPLIESERAGPQPELLEALGVTDPVEVMKAGPDYLVEARSEVDVKKIDPDFTKLRKVNMRGVMVTAPGSDPEIDFVSRFFAPAAGIDEDPVTGSAHCALGPYWGGLLIKSELRARQISARGGELSVRLNGDRVILTGKAVKVWEGTLRAV